MVSNFALSIKILNMERLQHNQIIKEQFAKQAVGYSAVKAHGEALSTLIEMSGVHQNDLVLDLACGSGIVSCAFAKHAKHVTGIDITPEMLDQARQLQTQNKLSNMDWVLADVDPLPFMDHQFSIVVTRFSFHHFLAYEKVFEQMVRVCAPGGVVMVVDVAVPASKCSAYDQMEKLRDPSHTGVLTPQIFRHLFSHPLLTDFKTADYKMNISLNTQLAASYMTDENKKKFRQLIYDDIYKNNLGVSASLINNHYELYYPVHIYMATKTKT